jgi:uncharacterized phage-associated protein
VFPALYHSLKKFRANAVDRVPLAGAEGFASCELSDDDKSIILSVYNAYKKFNGVQLSSLTHQKDTPWDQAWKKGKNSEIENEVIKAHFDELNQKRAA